MSDPGANRDLYQILGVSRGANEDEIRRAYRKLARKHHPDVNPGNKQAEERFKQVSGAYEVLSNPEKRKLYDEFGEDSLRSGFDPAKARSYQQWARGREATGQPFANETFDFDLGDLFSRMGGARTGTTWGGAAAEQAGRARRAVPGPDMLAEVEIDLEQAIRGAEVELMVPTTTPCPACHGSGDQPGTPPRTCPACGGSGQQQAVRGPMRILATCQTCGGEGRLRSPCGSCGGAGTMAAEARVRVRIPPGADEGTRLRVTGKGAPGRGGGPPGDLVIATRLRPHPWFRRDGLDLHLRLPVTIAEAYAGATVEVPTPDGMVKLRVPPRSQPGTRLRLRGKGVPRGGERGDLYAELEVRLPDREDDRFAAAVREAERDYSRPVREGIRL